MTEKERYNVKKVPLLSTDGGDREEMSMRSCTTSKMAGLRYLTIVLSGVFLLLCLSTSTGKPEETTIHVKMNPFSLPTARGIPGKDVRVAIQKGISINKDIQISQVRLEYETFTTQGDRELTEQEVPREDLSVTSMEKTQYLVITMPSWHELKDIRTQRVGGIFVPYKADLKIDYQAQGQEYTVALPVGIPSARWAFIWGLLAVLVSFALIWVLMRKSASLRRTRGAARFFLFPLQFAITPIGTYSVSLTQILLWTYITVFGIVYVYFLTGTFLEITSQLLMLLGIGGGTALAAKINAMTRSEDIPEKYMELVETTQRRPELRNLICIGDKLNVFKFQILVFTLLTGYMVLREILQTRAFPLIPENLIALMGVSSAVYLGNEIAQPQKKDLWKQVQKLIDAVEKEAVQKNVPIETAEQIESLQSKRVTELKRLLRDIYS
jgi:hypothetical protein